MKLIYGFFIILIFGLISCLKEPEFTIPPLSTGYQAEDETSDIKTAINRFNQSGNSVYTFDTDINTIVSAFVISSDEAGNFYKTLVVQDHPENPSSGLEIKVDLRSYYSKYNIGRKIYIRFSGLSIERINGKYVLGYLSENSVGDIPESLLDHFIIRSSETVEIIPYQITLSNVSTKMVNTLVQLDGIQFAKNELGKSFSSEAVDKYNGERIFEQCDNLSRGLVLSSTFADFSNHLLPKEVFRMQAILSIDSFSGNIVFIVNNPEEISINNQERCDPLFFECAVDNKFIEKKEIYYENFERLATSRDIEKIGWENINVNYGNGRFRKRSSDDNTFLQISAYNSNEYVMDIWLISPLIDLSQSENEILTFETRATFEQGTLLSCWFSTDYDDEIYEANWQQLDVAISIGSRDGSNDLFLNSGQIKLDCLEGKIRLAFRYLGSDPIATTTYDLDNIVILGDPIKS